MTTEHVSAPREFGTWEYHEKGPTESGDQRCICTIDTDGMVYVGIAIWTANFGAWFQNGTPLIGRVLAWMPLPEPAKGRWAHGKLIGADNAILSRATPSDESAELNYAKSLATSMWEKHYAKDAPQWELCDDLYGVLSQIDNMLTGLQLEKPSAPRVVTDEDVERAEQAVSQALGDAYDCTRVWEAWSYGTMSEDDFIEVRQQPERLNEIAMAVIESFATSLPVARVPDGWRWEIVPIVLADMAKELREKSFAAAPQAGGRE